MKDDSKKIAFGAFIILIAGLVILKGINPGFMNGFFGELSVWNIIWTAVLVMFLLGGIIKKHLFVVIGSLAFLLFIYEGKFGIPHIPAWAIFPPAALIYIGLEAIFPRKWHVRTCRDENGNYVRTEFTRGKDEDSYDGATVIESDEQNVEVQFGSTVKYFDMQDFKHSKLECNFGSLKAYYDKTKMAENEAFINAEQNFGETEIYIPKEWKSNIIISKAFGGIREFGNYDWDGEHVVNIKAEANFGEIKIYHI